MGGSKNISPAQKEKKQQRSSDAKKGKKDSKGEKNEKAEISVVLMKWMRKKLLKMPKLLPYMILRDRQELKFLQQMNFCKSH